MNDDELSTAVRESVAGIHSATPVTQIISRGHRVRARRWAPGVAGAVTVAAGAALAVTTLIPASPAAASHPGTARLAAWTVAKESNGDINVTINQLKDPAGLQATLRADGLPVIVNFSGPMFGGCQPYNTSTKTLGAVAQIRDNDLVIDPAALPAGAGLDIFDQPGAGYRSPGGRLTGGPLAIGLVHVSQRCTG
jgi:hypothetical protein